MPKVTSEYLSIRDVKLTIRHSGVGENLLLLHGANGHFSWLPIVEELAKYYHVILPDHPGFGDTKAPDWMDNISDMAYFYKDVIEAMELNKFHLAGHSMGGWIAIEIAIRDVRNIASLTLVSSAGINVNGVPMGDLFAWSPQETIKKIFSQKILINKGLAHEPDEEEIETALKNRQMAARLCWSPRFHNPDLKKWLHRLTIPTLILWGDSDNIFPEPYAHAFNQLIPNSELEIFENCGHVPMLEAKDAFIDRINSFISGA